MQASGSLFDLVKKLSDSRPFDKAYLESLVDQTLTRNNATSNAYLDVYSADLEKHVWGVSRVELRMPTSESDKGDGLVILSVAADEANLQRQDVPDWLGNGVAEVARPDQPDSMPMYVKHPFDWGSISVGYARDRKDKCIRSVVINAMR